MPIFYIIAYTNLALSKLMLEVWEVGAKLEKEKMLQVWARVVNFFLKIFKGSLSEFNSNLFPGIHKRAANYYGFGLNKTNLAYTGILSPSSITTGVSKKVLRAAESNGTHYPLTFTYFGDLSLGSYTLA